MLDYKLLEALVTVIDQGGFERGARYLGLTQSAVSQRIKLLEARLGQPVLVRSPRLAPTPLGRKLLNHAQQVRLLEGDLLGEVPALGGGEQRLRLAINADSLATWWPEAIGRFCEQYRVLAGSGRSGGGAQAHARTLPAASAIPPRRYRGLAATAWAACAIAPWPAPPSWPAILPMA